MKAIRRSDTTPELALRSELHRRGLRFRVDHPVPVTGRSPRPDIVFTRHRVVVFVDGCFWHGCDEHGRRPKINSDYWGPKIARNIQRDAEQGRRLIEAGWTVLRIWEHETLDDAISRVLRALPDQ